MKLVAWTKWLFWNVTERRLRAIWRLGIYVLLVFALINLFTFVLLFISAFIMAVFGMNITNALSGAMSMQLLENPWVNMIVTPGAVFLAVFGAAFITGRWVDRRKFADFGLAISKAWWRDFAFGLGLGAVLMGLVFLFGWLIGSIRVVGLLQSLRPDVSVVAGLFQSLVFFIFVGLYEEMALRGVVLVNLAEGLYGKWLNKRWALLGAWVISSLIFGVLHWGNPNATWVSTLNISLAGIFLGLGMVLTGSLAIPMGLHITWNFFQGNVFGFPVSGLKLGASVITTESIGPQWLTGGVFGPEAGVLGLGAMLIGILLTLLWVRWKRTAGLHEKISVYNPWQKDAVHGLEYENFSQKDQLDDLDKV